MKRTISAMVGHGSVNHNSRKFHAKNTDPERSHLNVTYCQENIKAVYHELFDEALERYNAKQTRADRRIENYYEKIRSGKQEKPFHEIILQVGNKDDMSADSNEGRLAADFSTDPEEILPEAGTLESAKSYREKKAKPLLAKIVKVLRSLFRKYIDLKGKFDRLQGDYDRVREGNARLSDRLMEVKMENKKLRQISADYTRVKRVFGPEQVQAAVEADKQREQAEKGRKRPRRSLDRGGR